MSRQFYNAKATNSENALLYAVKQDTVITLSYKITNQTSRGSPIKSSLSILYTTINSLSKYRKRAKDKHFAQN